jgi:hypothetical protein
MPLDRLGPARMPMRTTHVVLTATPRVKTTRPGNCAIRPMEGTVKIADW